MSTPNSLPVSRRAMMQAVGVCGAAALGAGLAGAADEAAPPRPSGQKSALGLKHPPLETVRVGMVGGGARGRCDTWLARPDRVPRARCA